MSTKKIIVCIVVSMLILALFGLAACDNPSILPSGEDGEKVSISGGATAVNDAIQEAKATNGVLVSYTITASEDGTEQSSTVTFGAKGDKYYFLIEGDEIIYDLSGNTGMDVYTKEANDTLWTKTTTPYTQMSKQQATDAMNESYATVAALMTNYSVYSAEGAVFVKAGTEEIAGHTCTKYKYTVSILGSSMSTVFWVEESTGICFKVGYEGNIDGAEDAVSIVLSQYKETYNVSIPTESQIDNGSGSDCNHVDEDNDGICDICDEPYAPQEEGTVTLSTPSVDVDPDDGLASWSAITNATGYICKVNGVEKAKQTATTIQLSDGDTLSVKAVGDGDKKKDSAWSKQATYDANPLYDFSNLGLPAYNESTLISYMEAEVGYYPDSKTYKCTNGDVINIVDDTSTKIFSRTNGYIKLTLVTHPFGAPTATNYELTKYMDNKYGYYAELSSVSVAFTVYTESRENTVFADYQAYIDSLGYEVLDYNEYKIDDDNAYELEYYIEYSGDFDNDYLNTKYLHPCRSFSYLEDYSSKITSWEFNRVNKDGKNYTDNSISIQFNEDFTDSDYLDLVTMLRDEYGIVADNGSDFELSGYDYNIFEGEIKVYDFPFEGDGDYLADRYKLFGGFGQPYRLEVYYTYLVAYDGGTFATYVITRGGVYRYVDEVQQLMIASDGTVQEHIKPPYKTLNDFEISYTLDVEGDAESAAEDYFVDTFEIKKVDDYILYTITKENSKEYTVYRIDDKRLYMRSGTSNEGGAVEWSDFDYYSDSYYYDVIEVYGELIVKYFEKQILSTETGSATVAGESCTEYTYEDEYYTYTYYANADGITLRYIEEDNDGNVCTREMTSYDDSVSSFTALEQSIIDDSGISDYNGEE